MIRKSVCAFLASAKRGLVIRAVRNNATVENQIFRSCLTLPRHAARNWTNDFYFEILLATIDSAELGSMHARD